MKILKIGRNDPCPCGSGLKYKKCCYRRKTSLPPDSLRQIYYDRYKIRLKSQKDVDGIRRCGRLVIETLDLVEKNLRPGMTTDDINTLVHEYTLAHNGRPAPLHYRGFPKSVCVSLNEEICHGIPGGRRIMEGDIVNVDVTTVLDGYYADANKTFCVPPVGPQTRKIVDVTRECLRRGIAAAQPGNTVGDIGWAIQNHAESKGCSVVTEFVGHGVGFDFHEPPQIFHYGRPRDGVPLAAGMVFTIEPMINLGKPDLVILDDQWTAVTRDGSLSAQFEQTILVTENGNESLTPFALESDECR